MALKAQCMHRVSKVPSSLGLAFLHRLGAGRPEEEV